MTLLITSDVHLGSRHCRVGDFNHFLDRLPASATLVLNGDTVDHPRRRLAPVYQESVDRLIRESRRRRVIWVAGNHDEHVRPAGCGDVEFVSSFIVPGRLCVVHGFYLHRYIPGYEPLAFCIKGLHRLRILMGAEPVHVAQYIRRWKAVYGVLCRYVRQSAVRYARAQGVGLVVCGHIHNAEDTVVEGIRYVNTGTWTEAPPWCLRVEEERADLCRVTPAGELAG
jgi:UDP-2,3-diacylglucosamine pyrophosphatase LpxH